MVLHGFLKSEGEEDIFFEWLRHVLVTTPDTLRI